MGQWLVAWLAGRQSLRPSARRSYQHHLDTYLLPRIGTIPLVMLTAADLRAMFTAMGRQRSVTGAPLSAGDFGADPRYASGRAQCGDLRGTDFCQSGQAG